MIIFIDSHTQAILLMLWFRSSPVRHEGDCGNHSGPRSLIHKMLRQGFYWPTMKANIESLTKMWDRCQWFVPVTHSPSELLSLVNSPNTFIKLAMDIVGPLSLASYQRKFILATTDYYFKWVEADAFAQVKEKDIVNFVWKEVIYQSDFPKKYWPKMALNSHPTTSSDKWKITLSFLMPIYPQVMDKRRQPTRLLWVIWKRN